MLELVKLINIHIFVFMRKGNKIIIDLDKWTTQVDKASSHYNSKTGKTGCSVEYICKLVRNGKLRSLKIHELNLHLVEK